MPHLFTSARLGFRTWSLDDVDHFAALNADPEVMKHFPAPLTREETIDFIHRLMAHQEKWGYCYFAVEVLESDEFIGFIGLARQEYESAFTPATDIGWRLKRAAWGKGYATEGAKRCLEWAFDELNEQQIISTCTLANTPSENVMRKIGMTKKGEFNHPKLVDYPEYERCLWYEIKKAV